MTAWALTIGTDNVIDSQPHLPLFILTVAVRR